MMTKCHACRRESAGKCKCGNQVCHVHDFVITVINTTGKVVGAEPQCLDCRWGSR